MRIQSATGDPCAVTTRTDVDPGGQVMVRYFYSWTPLVIVGTFVLLTLPWLGLIALVLLALAALATLVSAIVSVAYALGRAASGLWHIRAAASPRPAAILAPTDRRPAAPAISASIVQMPSERDATSKPHEPRLSLLV